MHDCRQTRAQLTDLVFDELPPRASARLHAELTACAACRREYDALAALTRTYAHAAEATAPPAEFWPGYHARLAARLQQAERTDAPHDATPRRAAWFSSWLSSLRRACTTAWRVPAPVALATLVALFALSAAALRPAPAPVVLAAPPQGESLSLVRTVEVPVVQEKIITRTVYVTRAPQLARAGVTGRRESGNASHEQAATRVALTGFKPAADVQLRIIKGSYTHEQ